MKNAMRTIMVRYTTDPDHAEDNQALVCAVFEELRTRAPTGLHYACYRLPGTGSFVHLATLASADDNPLTTLASFKAFQRELKTRCVAAPVVTELAPVGSYAAGVVEAP